MKKKVKSKLWICTEGHKFMFKGPNPRCYCGALPGMNQIERIN